MASTNEKLKKLKEIHSREEALYAERNEKYGDSFSKTYQKRGHVAAIVRMEDKLDRADYLLSHGLMESDGESVIDTLMDLSNYVNMTIMELMGTEAQATTKAPRKKKAEKEESTGGKSKRESSEEGPLDGLSKKQLVEVIGQLGGESPKKANRKKLYDTINQFPKAKIAVAITSVKSNQDSSEAEGTGDGEEE